MKFQLKYLAALFVILACATATFHHARSQAAPLFPEAAWLYARPVGTGLDLQYLGAQVAINTHVQGFDFPVAFADGSNGYTTFQDSMGHSYSVPNPAGGYVPSKGGWGYNDGHLAVVDTNHRAYYDFWKLYADGNGNPYSDWVGEIVSGSLDGNGGPGTTAASITGAAGALMPGELENGINHALSCVIPYYWNNQWVGTQSAAQKTDGGDGGPMSEGGKIGIAPSVDLSTLDVGTGTLHIMQALQTYGCVVTDQTNGNLISIYSSLPDLNGEDLRGLDQVGRWLRFYF